MQVLSEYANRDECQAQVEKQVAAAAAEAAKGTNLEGCKGLLAELGSLCTKDSGKEQDSKTTGSTLFRDALDRNSTRKPLIEEIESSSVTRKPLIEEL